MPGIERSRLKCQPVHPDFLCNLCGEVLWLPLQSTSCQHIFCTECITRSLADHSNDTDGGGYCPIDHSNLSREKLSEPARDLVQSLAALEVMCDYYSNGCHGYIKLNKLAKHNDRCLYNPNQSIKSKIETILKVQKSLSSHYVKQLLNLLEEKEKIVNEQEGLINKILEEGNDLDQIVKQFTQEKVLFEKEKMSDVKMLEVVVRRLQAENDDLRARLHITRQKLIQSNINDIGQLNGQQIFIYSDASTSNSCESLSMSSRQVLNKQAKVPIIEVNRSNSGRASVASTVKPVSPSHANLMKKVKRQLCESTYNTMTCVDLADFYDLDPYNTSWASYVSSRLQRVLDVVKSGDKVLVLSSWSDLYIPVCLALFVGPDGLVVTRSVSESDISRIRKNHSYLLDSGRLILAMDEPDAPFSNEGFPSGSPYDVILVPKDQFTLELEEQRKPSGIAFDPYTNTNLTPDSVPQFVRQ